MQAFLQTFLTDLGITLESLEVIESGEDLHITIKTPDSSLLIGQHGKNMEAFKHII
jgi:predicted RNA-binding protein Jag